MSVEDIAEALQRQRTTVYNQLASAKAQLEERARKSERAAAERCRQSVAG